MKFITISFIFAAGVNSAPTWLDNLIGYEETPDNKYNGYEQAPYTVIKNTTDYEVRQYPELKYVCTDSVTYPYSPSQSANSVDASWDFFRYFEFVASQRAEKSEQSKNFWKLFRYIQGENKKNQKIEMTVPVTTKMQLSEDGMMTKNMCFFIPQLFQSNPPEPTNPSVKIYSYAGTAIVKRFGGYIMEDSLWMMNADQFREVLQAQGVNGYDMSYVLTAGYDSPMTFWGRRNEVMFMKV